LKSSGWTPMRDQDKRSFPLDFDAQIAGWAAEKIVRRIRRDAVKVDYGSVVDPAARALIDAAARRLVIGQALEAHVAARSDLPARIICVANSRNCWAVEIF